MTHVHADAGTWISLAGAPQIVKEGGAVACMNSRFYGLAGYKKGLLVVYDAMDKR